MPKTRKTRKKAEMPATAPLFCTECGDALNDFCFEEGVTDVGTLKKNREKCEHTGKAKGAYCSKLFIAEPVDPELLDEED